MHHFVVVKFSKIFFATGGRGIDPPNQNPADALVERWYNLVEDGRRDAGEEAPAAAAYSCN